MKKTIPFIVGTNGKYALFAKKISPLCVGTAVGNAVTKSESEGKKENKMNCPNCGKQNTFGLSDNDWEICPDCGHFVEYGEEVTPRYTKWRYFFEKDIKIPLGVPILIYNPTVDSIGLQMVNVKKLNLYMKHNCMWLPVFFPIPILEA